MVGIAWRWQCIERMSVKTPIEFDDMPNMAAVIDLSKLSELRSNAVIEYIEPVTTGTRVSQDTTWNVKKVNAPAAWASATGSGEKLLIIDSGVQQNHFDLNPDVVGVCDGGNTWDSDGHGTEVAGIAVAVNKSTGIIGLSLQLFRATRHRIN